jgi:hypothetical protein
MDCDIPQPHGGLRIIILGCLQVTIHLCAKMASFHQVLVSSAFNRREAWTFYFAIYLPSIGYSLPLCHFTKSELDLLHRKVMSEMIAHCGFCRKTKLEIVYGPADLGGACFCHPYGEQGRQRTNFVIFETLAQSGTGTITSQSGTFVGTISSRVRTTHP